MGVIQRNLGNILENNMMDYYNDILKHRAIPDVRDGLMEVQRRTIYGAYEIKAFSNKPHVKSVKVVSQGLLRHPHGDSALYIALTNMAQYWKNHLMYFDKNGSVGTVYGDEPAAMRYLEIRLHKNAENLLLDQVDNCVDFKKTFDEDGREPTVLPAKLPLYIINGTFGVAGGYAVNVPLHNPKEVISETIAYIKDRKHQITLRPDFPTGGIILDNKSLSDAYTTGRSNYIMRAYIEKDEKHNKLIIKELPYMITRNNIMDQLKDVTQKSKDKKKKDIPPKIPGISSIDDNSAEGDVELHITVKNGYSLKQIEAALYKYTSLQVTNPFIMIGVEDDEFKIYKNINQVIDVWLNFRIDTVKRMKFHYVKQWNYRIHIIDGLLKILDPKIINTVINKIMNTNGKSAVIEMLENDYGLTSKQATSVAEMALYRISKMSVDDLKNERAELDSKMKVEIEYLKNPAKIEEYIINELEEIDSKIKCERHTRLVKKFDTIDLDAEENIPDKKYSIIITHQGYVKKRIPIKEQKRNGKGYTLGTMKDGDYPVTLSNVSERDFIYVCTSTGKMYKFEVREFDETGTKLGTSIKGRINGDKITSCLIVPRDIDSDKYSILTVSKLNRIKQTKLSEFKNISSAGIICTKLSDKDEIVEAILLDNEKENHILISNSLGYSVMISSKDIPTLNRVTTGVLAFNSDLVGNGGEVVSVDYHKDDYTHAAVIMSNGLGKLVEVGELYGTDKEGNKKLQSRGTKGLMIAKLKDNTVVSCKFCTLDEQVTIISKKNMISINTGDISVYKRTTYGMSVMSLDNDDKVVEITIP